MPLGTLSLYEMCPKKSTLKLFSIAILLHLQSDSKQCLLILFQAPAGAEGYPQYGPGPGAWGSYDAQRAQGSR